MSIVTFLYRYVFRSLGIVLAIGMLTILLLAIYSQTKGPHQAGSVPTAKKRTP